MDSRFFTSYSLDELEGIFKKWIREGLEQSKKVELDFEQLNRKRLTRKQIREIYNISYSKIHQHMRSGELPYEKEGRKTLFRAGEVEKFFSKKRNREDY